MKHDPTFSICIPNYNREQFIESTIKSVLGQTFEDFELIIVDNLSTDLSWDVITSFHDNRIRAFQNPVNLGMVANWNICLKLCRGKFIKILMSDDLLMPDCLEKTISIFRLYPEIGVMSSARVLIDSNDYFLSEQHPINCQRIYSTKKFKKNLLLNSIYLAGPPTALSFKAELLAYSGYFTEYYPNQIESVKNWGPDWEFLFRLIQNQNFYYLNDALVSIRKHTDSCTVQYEELQTEKLLQILNLIKYLKSFKRFYGLNFYLFPIAKAKRIYFAIVVMVGSGKGILNTLKILLINLRLLEIISAFVYGVIYRFTRYVKKHI